MKNKLLHLLIWSLNIFIINAQTDPPAAITINASKYFNIDAYNMNKDTLALTLNVNIYATYFKKDGSEKIKVCIDSACKDAILLNYPIVFNEIAGYLSKSDKIVGYNTSTNYMSTSSLLKIYYWLNSINYNYASAPLSGILHLKPLVRIYNNMDDEHVENSQIADDWIIKMNTLTAEIQAINKKIETGGYLNLVKIQKEKIDSINRKINIKKNYDLFIAYSDSISKANPPKNTKLNTTKIRIDEKNINFLKQIQLEINKELSYLRNTSYNNFYSYSQLGKKINDSSSFSNKISSLSTKLNPESKSETTSKPDFVNMLTKLLDTSIIRLNIKNLKMKFKI